MNRRFGQWSWYAGIVCACVGASVAVAQQDAAQPQATPPASPNATQAPPTPETPPPRPEARVEFGLGDTDNLFRRSPEVRSDITSLGTAFNVRRDQRLVRGSLVGDIQYLKYGAEGLADDSELLGSVDGNLELHVVPERFHWDFGYDYGQARTDPRAPVGPANRQRTTVTSTGPEVSLPFGGRTVFEFGARVADRRFETSTQLDSRLTTLRVGVRRDLSPIAHLTVSLDHSENEFERSSDSYAFRILSVEYRKELASGEALASLGRGDIETGGRSEPTVVARLNWRRALGTRSRIEVWGGRELTDAGSLFASGGVGGGYGPLSGLAEITRTNDGRLHGVTLSSSPLRHDSAGARFQVNRPGFDFSVSYGLGRDRFETDSTLDNEFDALQVDVAHRFGQRWRGELALSRYNQDFAAGNRENGDETLRLTVARELARGSVLSLTAERNRRVSGLDPFDEHNYRLSFGHNFGR